MEITVNVNDYVWVRLTPAGEARFWSYLKDLLTTDEKVEKYIEVCSKPVDGWTRFQLHELMNIFGPTMFNGSTEHVIEGNEISFLQKPYH